MKSVKILAAAFIFFAMYSSANATTIFNDRGAWESASSSIITVDFEGIAPDTGFAYQGMATTINGISFTSPAGMFVVGKDYQESAGVFSMGSGAILFGYSQGVTVATGSGNVTSFGVKLRGYYETSTSFDILLSTGEMFSTTVSNPSGGFFGISSDVAFSSVTITPQNIGLIMDDFSFADKATPTPVPAAIWIFGSGIAGLAGLRRRKKKTV